MSRCLTVRLIASCFVCKRNTQHRCGSRSAVRRLRNLDSGRYPWSALISTLSFGISVHIFQRCLICQNKFASSRGIACFLCGLTSGEQGSNMKVVFVVCLFVFVFVLYLFLFLFLFLVFCFCLFFSFFCHDILLTNGKKVEPVAVQLQSVLCT